MHGVTRPTTKMLLAASVSERHLTLTIQFCDGTNNLMVLVSATIILLEVPVI